MAFISAVEVAILIGTIWVIIYLYFTRHFNHWKNKRVPFLKPIPFFGNMLDSVLLWKSAGEVLYDFYKRTTEPCTGIFLLDTPSLFVKDPEIVKSVLVTDFQNFYDRVAVDNTRDDPLACYILFIIRNPDWRELRTRMTPVFTSAKMKVMHKLIQESGGELVEYLEQAVKKNPIVECREVCAKYTTDVITTTAYGVNSHCFKDENAPFRIVSRKIFDWTNTIQSLQTRCYFMAPGLVRFFRMKLLSTECTGFLKETFVKIMKERLENKKTRNDMIDILIQMQMNDKSLKLDEDKIVAQAIQFFVAGFETTSTTMFSCLFELAKAPEYQNRVREEITEVLSRHNEMSYDAMKQMEYLEMCVKETLRKYPAMPFLDRRCNKKFQIPNTNVVIDVDTPVFVSLLGLHYDPEHFPEPEKFNPERFSSGNIDTIKPYTYLPFGTGPRNCIGERFGVLNAKMGLAHILKNFEISFCTDTPDKIVFDPRSLLLAPLGTLPLNFRKI